VRRSRRHLLSDIGGVVLRLDLDRPAARMAERCSAGLGPAALRLAFRTDPVLEAYECGRVGRAEFIAHVRRRLGFTGSDDEFVAIWRAMFRPDPEIVAAWRDLSTTLRIWYFSNTSDMHVPWVYEAFPAMAVHEGHALSFELGARKPAPEFFLEGLRRLGLKADECLFVDDEPENCVAAERCGVRSLVHSSAVATIRAVRAWAAGAGPA